MVYKKSEGAIEGYRRKFREHGVNAKALQWMNQESARVRYEQIVADLDFEGKSVLDVGCGFGNVIDWIKKKATKFDYTGVDVVPEFVVEAKKLYPDQKFVVHDFYAEPNFGKFDIVMSSGTLNANVEDNVGFRKYAIKALFESCREVAVFNMLGRVEGEVERVNGKVWYADKREILDFCMSLTSRVIFRSAYHKRDFTVVMFR